MQLCCWPVSRCSRGPAGQHCSSGSRPRGYKGDRCFLLRPGGNQTDRNCGHRLRAEAPGQYEFHADMLPRAIALWIGPGMWRILWP